LKHPRFKRGSGAQGGLFEDEREHLPAQRRLAISGSSPGFQLRGAAEEALQFLGGEISSAQEVPAPHDLCSPSSCPSTPHPTRAKTGRRKRPGAFSPISAGTPIPKGGYPPQRSRRPERSLPASASNTGTPSARACGHTSCAPWSADRASRGRLSAEGSAARHRGRAALARSRAGSRRPAPTRRRP
jgi:hypothetical protein